MKAPSLLKFVEWQSSGSEEWHCNDTSDLASIRGLWWVPARLLGMTPANYVKWLIENYKPDHISFNNDVLLFSWDKSNYAIMHKFVLYINKVSRDKKFLI